MKPIITPEEMADRLDRDASTMDVGRPPVQCTRRKAANMIRQMSLDIAVLKGKGNVWQEAVDHQRVITHLGIANDIATQEEAHKALNEVIAWHVNVAIDPAVNGGFSLQPVKPTPAAVAVPDERAAFECDWLLRHYPLPMNTRLRDDGRYGDHIIQGQLEAWCAGRAGGVDAKNRHH